MPNVLQATEIETYFTGQDGQYRFARWGRPISPIVFGVEDTTLPVIKGAFEAVCAMSGHKMAETDPELGANVMVFFLRDWEELRTVPDLGRMIDGLDETVTRLAGAQASHYRVFRFDDTGAIQACFVFLRMAGALAELPADVLALGEVVQVMLTWSDAAFASRSPLGQLPDGRVVLRPEIGALIRAAYDPVMPAASRDSSHAMRLSARLAVAAEGGEG